MCPGYWALTTSKQRVRVKTVLFLQCFINIWVISPHLTHPSLACWYMFFFSSVCVTLEPVEFFQKQCDMITLQLFQDRPGSIVLDLSYAHDLFIGYAYESSVAVVQS